MYNVHDVRHDNQSTEELKAGLFGCVIMHIVQLRPTTPLSSLLFLSLSLSLLLLMLTKHQKATKHQHHAFKGNTKIFFS